MIFCLKFLWRLFVITLCVILLLVCVLYLGFTQLNNQQQWLQGRISTLLQQPVTLNQVNAHWENWIPVLQLKRFQLTDADGVTHSIRKITVRFDPVASLLHLQLITNSLTIDGSRLGLRNENGQISFAGMRNDANDVPVPDDAPTWLHWLLQQTHLQLQDAEIEWYEPRHAPLLFSNVDLQIVRQGEQHAITGELHFPPHESELPLIIGSGLRMQGGALRFNSISAWERDRLLSLQGKVQIGDARLLSNQAEIFLANVQGELDVTRANRGWRIDVDNFTFDTGKHQWPQSQLNLASIPEADGRTRLEIQLGFLQLNELVPLLTGLPVIPANIRQALTSLEPQADLHATQFSYIAGKQWRLRTHVTNWHNYAWNDLPGLSNWSGALTLGPEDGALSLHSEELKIALPRLYSDELVFNSLNGEVTWAKNPQGWAFATTGLYADDANIARLKLAGAIQLSEDDSSPYGDLSLSLENMKAEQVYRYLPDREERVQKTIKWLREGLVSGLVANGNAILQGPLDAVPFKNDEGTLQATLEIRDLDMKYHRDWPMMHDIDATLSINNERMNIKSKRGRVYDISLTQAEANMPDLSSRRPVINIQGHATGSAEDGLKFINNSPLRERVGISDLVKLGGPIEAMINLDLALYKAGKDTVSGEIHFPGNTLDEQNLGLTLTDVTGKLHFSEDDVSGDDIQAQFLDTPVVMQIRNLSVGDGNITRASLRGKATPPFLATLSHTLAERPELYLPWLNHMQGETLWQGHFDFSARYPTTIDIITDLIGMDIQLPSPIGKTPETPRRLRVSTHPRASGETRLRVRHANIFDGELDMKNWQGSVVLGGQIANYENTRGLEVSGYLPSISLSDWAPFVEEWWNAQPKAEEDATQINALDMLVDRLEVSGFFLNEVRIQALRGDSNVWSAFLSGEEVLGQLQFDEDNYHVSAGLARLHLLTEETTDAEDDAEITLDIEPTNLPSIEVICDDCSYNSFNLGVLTLSAHPERAGWRIDNFALELGDTRVSANGLWSRRPYPDGKPVYHSHIQATLESDNFGDLLSELGYQSTIIGGKGSRLTFNGVWPDLPVRPDLDDLQGEMSLYIGKGQLADVDPGVGRVFGLFDLQTVPHRLSLDFSDVFDKGLGFNSIEGNFDLAGGYAHTDNLKLSGPAVKVDINGRTSLVDQTYDQRMVVTPHASNTLPVAVVFAAGLEVGAIALILQKILQPGLESVIRYHYTITGDWANPEIKSVANVKE